VQAGNLLSLIHRPKAPVFNERLSWWSSARERLQLF
jgi:hypothetical protein